MTVGPEPRVAVIIPCYNDGAVVGEALASLQEDEPLEVVIVDDASTDLATREVLAELEAAGTRVVRHEVNQHLSAARNTGLASTSARYVYPLDADDQAVPGVLAKMADRLDAVPGAAVVAGDYDEFGSQDLRRAVPPFLDPFRIAYINEYPVTAMFRRTALEELGGWRRIRGYEDWDLWMALAERGSRMEHLGEGNPIYRRRLHGTRMLNEVKSRHRAAYLELRSAHPRLFAEIRRHRRASPMPLHRKLLYPYVYGARPRTKWERHVKQWLDDHGVWTLRG
ncbi:MAG TPA: glycosyltransferase family A protein [Solirubrobacteraceae bacterium]|jgi:glycosyltransferase involved in cell wall biosynthesis